MNSSFLRSCSAAQPPEAKVSKAPRARQHAVRRPQPCSSCAETPGALEGGRGLPASRRLVLTAPFLGLLLPSGAARALSETRGPVVVPANVLLELTPDQSKYDPADPELRAAAQLLQQALDAESVQREEALWTQLIDTYSGIDKNWVPDVVGRAWGNRGNARSRQGKLAEAISDFNTAIDICPWSVDPVLNRGVVLESLRRFDEAITDYKAVLKASPNDPAAWNNLGNASAGLGDWSAAAEFYGKAAMLAPQFSFAAGNQAVAQFQLGQTETAIRNMRGLLRKYPEFDDMRAGLTAALWSIGKEADAEGQWTRVRDPRYRDAAWLENDRRWPPTLRNALVNFLGLKSMKQ